MIKKNSEFRLEIESISSQGSGVGHFNGMTVFVDGAVTGDLILAHVIKAKSTYCIAIIKEIIRPSEHRIECDCPVFSRCGGCAFRQIEYSHELEMKRKAVEDALKRIGRIEISVDEILSTGKKERYRNKGIYPVAIDARGKTVIGFYAKKSHRIADNRDCLLAPEEFEKILTIVARWCAEFGVSIYEEQEHRGLLRNIFLRKAFATNRIMVCLVINGDVIPSGDILIQRLIQSDASIKSIVLNINKDKTNVALGKECKTLFGADFIDDELCGLKFRISPLSFFQVNPAGAEIVYAKAKEFASLKSGDIILDLYCGTGTIGLSMASECKEVIGVEIVPEAIENAKENAALNGIKNARFICADAEEAAKVFESEGLTPDCVILDPPRKGCSKETVSTVARMNPSRIVYVSCDPSTLARDCKRFAELGYVVKKATAVDMFPRTRHVETVTLITRVG